MVERKKHELSLKHVLDIGFDIKDEAEKVDDPHRSYDFICLFKNHTDSFIHYNHDNVIFFIEETERTEPFSYLIDIDIIRKSLINVYYSERKSSYKIQIKSTSFESNIVLCASLFNNSESKDIVLGLHNLFAVIKERAKSFR